MGVYGFYLGEADVKEEVLHMVCSYFIIKNEIKIQDVMMIFALFPL